jgi:glycosyltransferase involved in cell wall biosynthesis
MSNPPLVVVETHPVQYHAPVYRFLKDHLDVPVHVVYGSDFSVTSHRDEEFGLTFSWDTELVRGQDACTFLSQVKHGGATSPESVSTRGLSRVLSALRPGAVLLTGYQPAFYLKSFYCATKLGCPILFRAETTDHAEQRNRAKSWVRDHLLRSLYSRCSRLLPIGVRSMEHYRRLGCPENKLFRSPYCVDTTPFRCDERDRSRLRDATRTSLGLERGSIAVLFCGKLSRRKGPHVLLDGLKSLPADTRRRTTLLFMGEGQDRPELEALAGADPFLETRFVGFKNQSELSDYYHAADLLVLPSVHSETWGLVVNEALHHGVPCVVSDAVGCAPDLIDPGITGEIAASGSVESLRDAVLRLLPQIGSPKLRERCRGKIAGYTVEKAASGMAEAYWSLIQSGSALAKQS